MLRWAHLQHAAGPISTFGTSLVNSFLRIALRVLHLPVNIASQVSTTVRSLRMIGVDARGIVQGGSILQCDDGVELLPSVRKHPALAYVAARFRAYSSVMRAIQWADIVHYHFGEVALRGGL